MDQVQQSSQSMTARLRSAVSSKPKNKEVPSPPQAPVRNLSGLGHDPQLSAYINTVALKRPEGVSFTDLARALLDAKDRSSDKAFRAQLPALLLRLSFYEDLPSDVVSRLVPLFQVYAKDPRVIRSLFYLCTSHVTRGSAGTPTLLDPSLSGRGPDGPTLEAVVVEAQRVLRAPDADPAVRRAAALMLAAAGRSNDVARAQALESLAQMVDASDSLVSAAGAKSGRGKAPVVSSANWELQHSIFAGVRFSDAPAASTHLSGGCFIGVASPDPAGARHALALAAELALKDPTLVISELSGPVTEAADMYEAGGADAPREPGTAINLEDNFARMYLARTCAHVLHSDQSAGDVSRGGAPFWRMLCMLATRDSSDLVRFAALEALTGAVVTLGQASLAGGQAPGAREAAVLQQRRARAWRLLAANAAAEVIVPGVGPGGSAAGMKLMEVIGRLLLLALSKVESAARFTVAASVAVSLAESCLAAQAGTARQIASPDVDKVMTILARELGSLIESPLRPAQRCVCAEALLYLQAAGYPTTLTPAKLAQAGGHGASGTQGALLAAVLKCAKAKPKDATSFLAYASGVVGIAPSGIDLAHVTQLWDAAASGGKEGRSVALAAALEAMRSPPPPCTRPRAGASPADVVTAAKEDAGWNSFVAAAAWWLGENANVLCEEFAGRKVQPVEDAPNGMNGNVSESDEESPAPSGEPEAPFDDDDNDAAAPTQSLVAQQAVLDRHAGRNPALSAVISSLQDAALTSVWQLRAAAARALAKIAVRSGEPFRLQCYGILTACRLSGGRLQDALGLQSVAGPALAVLDRIYATQAKLEGLYAELGDDVEGWPPEIIASLARRNAALRLQVEQTVCSVPPERYALLGLKAVAVLAYAEEEGPAYAAFLEKSGGKEAVQAGTAATGPNLTAVKNREVEDILSFGGSEEASFKFLPEKETTAAAADRNKEIESMLSVTTTSAADAWAFSVPTGGRDAAAAAPSYNAFAEVPSPTKTASPRAFDREISIYGSGAPAEVPSPSPTLPSQPVADAPGTARVIGTGTMLHTFIADPNNPEELSIFEGDQVEVLEDSDGWLLVRDPSGSQGMVPTAYVHLERLFTGAGATGGQQGGGDVWASLARNTSALSSPTSPQRSLHARGLSLDMAAAGNEDYLDRFFNSAAAATSGTSSPGIPQGQAWNAPVRSPSGSPRKAAGTPTRFSPTWRQESIPTGGAAAADAANSPGGNPFGGAGGSTSPGPGSTGGPVHRRVMSTASSHQRTLSGGSIDIYGSMPGTPSRIDGPERSIAAPFAAEMEGELSVEPGDRVKVHSEVGGWARVLRVTDLRGGLVPSWAVGPEL